jgi:gamma-glutamyltranspeptidase/glutathione hydrolase
VVREGEVVLVAGSNGGPRIISAVLLTILGVIDWELDVSEAVAAPRFHHQWRPDVLQLEAGHPADVLAGLRRRGHAVELVPALVTGVEAIAVDPVTDLRFGGVDPRRDGLALGD